MIKLYTQVGLRENETWKNRLEEMCVAHEIIENNTTSQPYLINMKAPAP